MSEADTGPTLLCDPAVAGAACPSLFPVGEGPTHCLVVAYDRDPATLARRWREASGVPPASMTVLDATGTGSAGVDEASTAVESVGPADLATLGVRVTERLDAWPDDGNPRAVCLDSLTGLLDHVDPAEAFRFLHVFTRQAGAAGADTHLHVSPDAHDEEVLETFRTLASAEVDGARGVVSDD